MGQYIISFWETHSDTALNIIKNFAFASIILIIGILLSKWAQKLIKKIDSKHLSNHGLVKSLFKAIIRYGILIICAMMILNLFGVNTSSILAVLGVAGIAAGFALKDLLGNLVSGVILIVMESVRIGEFIEFTTFSGTVKDINLLTTILETPDGIYISAPNSSILGNPIKNYTRNGKRRMEISIGISYTDSVDAAFAVMQKLIDEEPRFLKEPAPMIILQSIDESSVKITIRAWAAVETYWNIYWDINKIIKAKIEEAGLHVPLPQKNILLIEPFPTLG